RPRPGATGVTVRCVQARRRSRMRHRRRARFAQQGVDDHHRPARFKAEIHAMEALAPQGFGHLLLELALAVEEEEAAAAGARNLATLRAGLPRLLPPLIAPIVGPPGHQTLRGHRLVEEVSTQRD